MKKKIKKKKTDYLELNGLTSIKSINDWKSEVKIKVEQETLLFY